MESYIRSDRAIQDYNQPHAEHFSLLVKMKIESESSVLI